LAAGLAAGVCGGGFGLDLHSTTGYDLTMAEKSLSDLPRDLRMLFIKGNEALQRDNFDYAIDLFNQVLAKEPAVYECRKALRTAQMQKKGGASGFFKKMLSSASSSPMLAKGHLALSKDPTEALRIAEQILNGDPTNSGAHKLAAEAAAALELPMTAVMSLEVLASNSPKDRDMAIQFAHGLADTGQVGRAEKLLAHLSALFPQDNELAQAHKDISARQTLDEGGYDALADGSGSYRDILKDKEEAVSLEQQNRQVKTEDVAERLISEHEARLKTEPRNLKLLRQLAELYTQKKQFDRAISYYDQIKASEVGGDASLDRNIADTVVRKFDHQIAQLDPNAPDHADQVAKLQAEKQAYQLAECQKRAERFPTDLQIRFELGQLYFQMGKITEAMKEFQKAQGNPHRRIQALSYLGQCFARRGINDLAATTFQDAIKEKVVFDDEKKELIYLLGCVLEKMGKREEAIAQFKIIYAVDVGYKDVAEKMDAYYSGQS
jgi:tetratricopeptide (TPR) repeat protein